MTGMDLINIAKETIKFTKEYIKKNNSSISAAKVFGYEHLRDIEKDKYYKENMYGAYYKLDYDMPLCNHKECMSDSHLGFAKGITYDGVPFEAELTQHGKTKTLCVIMPAIFYSSPIKVDLEKENKEDSNIVEIPGVEEYDVSILDIGMVDEGVEDDISVIIKYVDFLIEHEILSFLSNLYNGTVMYRVDELGNELAKILISLEDEEGVLAYTNLSFNRKGISKTEMKVVK